MDEACGEAGHREPLSLFVRPSWVRMSGSALDCMLLALHKRQSECFACVTGHVCIYNVDCNVHRS